MRLVVVVDKTRPESHQTLAFLAHRKIKADICEYIDPYTKKQPAKWPLIYLDQTLLGGLDDLRRFPEIWEQNMFVSNCLYRPFKFPWAVELAKIHEQVHWVEQAIDLSNDLADWNSDRITPDEKKYVVQILRLFTQSDVSVGHLYYDIFIPVFKNNELRCMLGSFANRESIHQRGYALLSDTLGLPETIYSDFLAYTEMSEKLDYMMAMRVDTLAEIALSVVKAVFNEGVTLFASFLMLLNFQRYGKMCGMGKVVEWSIRDESLHVQGMVAIYHQLMANYPFLQTKEFSACVEKLARTVFRLESAFVDLAFQVTPDHPTGRLVIPGLTADITKRYIQHIINKRLEQLNMAILWPDVKNPVPWIACLISGPDLTNFFENKVTEYEAAGLVGRWDSAYV